MFLSYGFTTYKRKTVIVLLYPYLPYEEPGEGYLPLDAYYVYSHKSYLETKEFIETLREKGIEADAINDPVFKKLAIKSGVAAILGTNSLAYSYSNGSRFVLSVVRISYKMTDAEKEFNKVFTDFAAEKAAPGKVTETINCYKCGACSRACPMGAIKYNGLTPQLCMRTYMIKGDIPDDEKAAAMGNKFMGCDICQRVCPMNKNVSGAMPLEIKQLLRIEDFLRQPKQQAAALKEFIGANYANPNRLLPMAINVAGNSGNKEYLGLIQPYLDSPGEVVRRAADRAIRRLNG